VVIEQIVGLVVDPNQNLVFIPLLTIELQTLAPFLAISNNPIHQIFAPTWKKLIILDQI
jgi:hypothetical protein